MIKIDFELFNENLKLTQAYCELQLKNESLNPATVLRSINPVYNGTPFFSFKFSSYFETEWQIAPWPSNSEFIYNKLFESQLAIKKKTILPRDKTSSFEGRILIAGIDETIADGASEQVSDGFIDGYDCPPIDTWFYMSENGNGRVIFAWIPESLVNLVNLGRDVNPVDCFYWYDVNSSAEDDWEKGRVSEQSGSSKSVKVRKPFLARIKSIFTSRQ